VINFHYTFTGNNQKPFLIFLHGFMGNIYEFDSVIPLLYNDFYILKIDLPGHGKTQVLDDNKFYKIEETAKALVQFLDNVFNTLNISRCFLIAYSMGGRLGLYLTLNYPQYFSRVILESASPGLMSEIERLERQKKDGQIARKLERCNKNDFLTFLDNWYRQPVFGKIKNHPNFQEVIDIRYANNPKELAKSLIFMGTGSQPSLWEKLKDNQVDLLLLVGEYDDKFIEINREMLSLCNRCDFQVISLAGHNIHFENRVAFAGVVKDFFSLFF
jgi:2-succinyl-6-hydroxy-2,4-cyclohexadiene-1-carboxylate synthase